MSNIFEYKCPCCNGALKFHSGVQKMKCPYCDNEFEMETLKEMDEELQKVAEDKMEWGAVCTGELSSTEAQNLRSYICQSCGGEIVGDATTVASSCPYCDSPVVMKGQVSGELKPDYIIPFKLDKQAAKEGLSRHLQGKKLLPKVFKSQNHIDEVKGIYVPYWIFDADVEANFSYKATKVRTWSDNNYNYRETSYYSAFRKGTMGFDGIPVDGSTKMADDLMESLEPFDLREAVEFQTAYMAGYLADKYDVSVEDSINRANERVKQSTEDTFRATVQGYDTVTKEAGSIELSNGKAKYALYPVWLLHTTWQGKQYTFAMNGQTGKFVGDLPMDKGAYWKWWGIYSTIISVAAFLLMLLIALGGDR